MELRDAINLQEAYLNVYAPEDLKEDYEIAAEYFYEQGLNDDGVAILIEELGIDEFTEWVEDILDDYDLMERKLSAGETALPARTRRNIVGGEIGAPRAFSDPTKKTTAGGKRRAARAAERKTTPSQTPRQQELATRLAAQRERNAAKEKAKSTQAPTPRSETPSQTRRGIGGLLKTVVDRAKADTEKVKQSWQTASDTKLAQRARIAAKKGSRAIEKHGAAVGGAAGRAAGTAVGATLRAGQRFGQSETGQRLKKGLGDAVKKAVFKEEVEEWVESLIDEGYDLSEYTWEDMAEMYMSESGWHRRNPDQIGSSNDPDSRARRPPRNSSADVRKPPKRTPEQLKSDRRLLYKYYGQPGREEAIKRATQARDDARARRRGGGGETQAESYDLFDIILEYLVTEGYADTPENALGIMSTMSEDWRQSIIEGEEKKKETPEKPFTGEGPKKPKGWKPTGPKRSYGQRPPSWDVGR